MDFRDYYGTLGVSKSSTEKEIKQAFRRLARKFHPDVNPGDKTAESRFKEINEAYEVLGDPEKRKKYDELGANWRMYEQAQQAYAGQAAGPGGPTSTWSVNVGGPEDFRNLSPEEVEAMFGGVGEAGDDPFSDFFRTFFGGRDSGKRARGGRSGRRRAGRDVEQDLQLSLEDAFQGATRRLSIKRDGHARVVDVRIPAGVRDGSRVRVPSEGEGGKDGAPSGDLYLRVHLAPHERFERRGNDLHVKVPVRVTTAVLGGEAQVPTLGGRTLRLKIPAATVNGQVFRLRGHGMPLAGKTDEHHGDLYATIDVEIPRTLTNEQRAHYEALAKLEAS